MTSRCNEKPKKWLCRDIAMDMDKIITKDETQLP